ncbi:hypothetical protein D3C79_961140 [compost metagenome]
MLARDLTDRLPLEVLGPPTKTLDDRTITAFVLIEKCRYCGINEDCGKAGVRQSIGHVIVNNELCHKGFGGFFGVESLTDSTAIFHELYAIATATLTGDFLNVCHG